MFTMAVNPNDIQSIINELEHMLEAKNDFLDEVIRLVDQDDLEVKSKLIAAQVSHNKRIKRHQDKMEQLGVNVLIPA